MKTKLLNALTPCVILLLMCLCCVYANNVSVSVRGAVKVCLTSLVPSMYGFMLIADLMVRTNSHRLVGKALSPIARHVFHLDGELFAVLLVSMVAGYPVGAKLVASMERDRAISPATARDMYCYCYCGGLAFVLGTIGKGNNGLRVALIVYVSNVVANLLLAVLLNLRLKVPTRDTKRVKVRVSSGFLVESIDASFRVMVTVCVMVVAFSVALGLLHSVVSISNITLETLLNALLEVSNVARLTLTGKYYLPVVATVLAFGGVCVTIQILAISGESFSLGKFLACRVFAMVVSFGICRVLCGVFLKGEVSVGYTYQIQTTQSTSVVPSICLLCMSFILLSNQTKRNAPS